MSLPQIPNIPQIPPSTRGRVCKNGGSHGPQHRFRTQRIRIDFGALQYPYSDDDAELQLRSEDGAIFKVQAFYLKAASGVFRSMLTSSAARTNDTTGPNATQQPPIEISAPSLIVRLFIDLMYHTDLLATASDPLDPSPGPSLPTLASTPPSASSPAETQSGPTPHFTDLFRSANNAYRGRSNAIAALSALLQLLDQFECGPGMRERALNHFEPTFGSDPWRVLCIAARYEDLALAKKAIGKFGGLSEERRSKVDPDRLDPREAETLPVAWLLGYFRAHKAATAARQIYQRDTPVVFWQKVAAAFNTTTPESPAPNTSSPAGFSQISVWSP